MPTPKRQKIVDKVVSLCEGISVANGYQTDIGAVVGDWVQHYEEHELPAVSVCDLEEDVQSDMNDEYIDIYRMSVVVRVQFAADPRPEEARKMIADVLKAIGTNPRLMDSGAPLAHRLDLRRTGFVQSEEAMQVAAANIELDVYYHTPKWNYY